MGFTRYNDMTTKEKIRFVAACALSVLFGVFSVLLLDVAFAEIFMMPSKMTETFYGFVLFDVVMAAIAILLIGIGTVCVGALAAFFAFSFWKHEKKGVRYSMRGVFACDAFLIALDLLAILILVF